MHASDNTLLCLRVASALMQYSKTDKVADIQADFAAAFSGFYDLLLAAKEMGADPKQVGSDLAELYVKPNVLIDEQDLKKLLKTGAELRNSIDFSDEAEVDNPEHVSIGSNSQLVSAAILSSTMQVMQRLSDIPMGQDLDVAVEYIASLSSDLAAAYVDTKSSDDASGIKMYAQVLPTMTELVLSCWTSAAITHLNPNRQLPSVEFAKTELSQFKRYVSIYNLGHSETLDILVANVAEYIERLSHNYSNAQTFLNGDEQMCFQSSVIVFIASLCEGSWREAVNGQLLELDKCLDDEESAVKWLNERAHSNYPFEQYIALLSERFSLAQSFTNSTDFDIDVVKALAKKRASLLISASEAIAQESTFWR